MVELARKQVRRLKSSSAVNCITYNASGNYILTGNNNRMIDLWNQNTGTHIKSYAGHGYQVLDLCCSTDSRQLASCGGDRAVFLWDVMAGRTVRRFHGHLQKVNTVAMSEDAALLFSGSFDSTLRIWDCRSTATTPVQVLDDARDSVTSIAVQNTCVITGSADGYMRCYDVRRGLLTTDCVGSPVTNVVATADGQCLLVSSLDSTIRLFDKQDGRALQVFRGHINTDYRVRACLAQNDAFVVSGSEDGLLCAWSVLTAEKTWEINAHTNQIVTAVDAHPSRNQLVSCGQDGSIYVYE